MKKLLLKREDDIAGFLRILLERNKDGSITLLQTGLIKRILEVMDLGDCNPKYTPAESKLLRKDIDGDPPSETWSYASVVGMVMYLSTNSRPDIAYAVHQCAKFTHCPRRSHELGMIINPTKDLALDLYADTDFAGLWARRCERSSVCEEQNWICSDTWRNSCALVIEVIGGDRFEYNRIGIYCLFTRYKSIGSTKES